MNRPARLALILCLLAASAIPNDMQAAASPPVVHKVGAVTWNARKYASQQVTVRGYVLAIDAGYVLFSDEPTGAISAHDLPVTGPGVDQMALKGKYTLQGRFVAGGLTASNGNPYHLELTSPPQPSAP